MDDVLFRVEETGPVTWDVWLTHPESQGGVMIGSVRRVEVDGRGVYVAKPWGRKPEGWKGFVASKSAILFLAGEWGGWSEVNGTVQDRAFSLAREVVVMSSP